MGAYQYTAKVKELPSPPIIKKSTYEQIKDAITELQKHAITAIKTTSNGKNALVIDGECFLDQIENGASAAAKGYTGTTTCIVEVWFDGVTVYKRRRFDTWQDGRLMSFTFGDSEVIDTPIEC